MKLILRTLLSIVCVTALSASVYADTWTYTPKSGDALLTANKNGTSTINLGVLSSDNQTIEWQTTISTSSNKYNSTYKTAQFGGSSNSPKVVLSTSFFNNKKIESINIETQGSSNKSSYFVQPEIKLDGTSVYLGEKINASGTTAASKKYDGINKYGDLTITYDASSGKGGMGIGNITITYSDLNEGPAAPKYEDFNESYSLVLGKTIPLPAITPSKLTYTFSTENNNIIKIDEATKTIEGVGLGTATVKFTTEAFGDEYLAGEGSFTVEVVKKPAKLTFADQIVFGKLGVGVVWQTVTVITPEDADQIGKITYSSSVPAIVSVNEETGQILADNNEYNLPGDVHAAGEVYITATMEESAEYASAQAKYKITILDPNAAAIAEGTDVFDFTVENAYGIPTHSTTVDSDKYEQGSKDTIEIDANKEDEIDYVSISFVTSDGSHGYRLWKSGDKVDLRIYEGTTMTISVPDSYKISQIGLTGTTIGGTFDPVSEGEHQDVEEWPDMKGHWHSGDVATNSVTFTPTTTNKINGIYVLYEGNDTSKKSADLAFTKTVYGIYKEEPATVNAVQNPNGLEVKYTIQNLNEEDYTIVPSEDGKTLKVTVNKPGTYTLEANSESTDTYRSGYAIMRLNVYYHLPVYLDGKECVQVRDGKEFIDISAPSIEDAQDLYSCFITFDVPANTNLYYKLNWNSGMMGLSEDDIDMEDGFELYEDGIEVWSLIGLMDPTANLEFYLGSYGYKSPHRTIALSYKMFNLPEGKLKYSGHDTTDGDTHKFSMRELIGEDFINMRGDEDELPIHATIEPQFIPLREEDLADYDKNNDAVKALIYEDATATLSDKGSYEDLIIYTKHAGLYKLTMTSEFGDEQSVLIEVEPNFTEPTADSAGLYLHGVHLEKIGEDTYNLDHADNASAHVDYIYTGHPTYGNDGQNGIWYKVDFPAYAQMAKGNKPQFASAPDADSADWTPVDKNGFDLIDENGNKAEALHLKLATNGVSKVQSFALNDFTTGVEVIAAEAGEALYIDLNGVRVDNPSEGVYIRIANGKAEKVVIVK